jgi:chromosome segregation ATPase
MTIPPLFAILPFDWFTGIVSLVSIAGTALVAYFVARRKDKTDSFESIIQANEKFRDEVRCDLNTCKSELERYKSLVDKLETDINQYEDQNLALKHQILEYKEKISEYEMIIIDLRGDLEKCRKKVQGK